MSEEQSPATVVFIDADNTLWDTDGVYADAQLALLKELEDRLGANVSDSDRLAFIRGIDQGLAERHHEGLRYPPRFLIKALALALTGSDKANAIRLAWAGGIESNRLSSESVQQAESRMVENLRRTPTLRPGVLSGLSELATEGFPLLVLTEGRQDRVRDIVRTHDLERYIPRARHVEIQVFGFGNGEVVHLYERDCSLQRRFQKIIEESPAPGLPDAVRARMAEAAVQLCREQRYAGAGTIEFIVDADSFEFFFLEMNTRIQVEHPVSEMTTGIDLVALQLEQARGTLVPFAQERVQARGHAIECRLYAENPQRNFMPSPGMLQSLTLPQAEAGMRVDTGFRQGDTITQFYDPMIAKLITHGATRAEAIARMQQALEQVRLEGPKSNHGFLLQVMGHDAFASGAVSTDFIERHKSALITRGDGGR